MHLKFYLKLQRNMKMSLGKRRVCIDFASTTSKTLYSYFKFDEFIMTNRLLKGIGNSFYSSSQQNETKKGGKYYSNSFNVYDGLCDAKIVYTYMAINSDII